MVAVPSTMPALGTIAPDFSLPDVTGAMVARTDYTGRPLLVVFLCNHCPFVKHLADDLARFAREAQRDGVVVVAINSNDIDAYPADAPPRMRAEQAARGWDFPYLLDETQAVAKLYRAACTPDFFLFDPGHRLYYRGQYDETRPQQIPAQAPHGGDLRRAVEALVSGKPAPEPQQPSIGCNIKWKPGNAPDYFGAA